MGGSYIRKKKNSKVTNNVVFSSDLHQCKCVTELSRCDESILQTDRQGDLTCQRCVGEMLRLAALPFAVDDVEVDFN